MNYSKAKALFDTARFPLSGKPMEGSKNLRMQCRSGIYYIEHFGSAIYMIKPNVTYWRVPFDSVTTKRHINAHATDFYVETQNSNLLASLPSPGTDRLLCSVDTNQWYCSAPPSAKQHLPSGTKVGFSRLDHSGSHVLQNLAVKTINPRRKTIDNRVLSDPRKGETFYMSGKTYIWIEEWGEGRLKAYEYRGEMSSWSDRYVYVGEELVGFTPSSSLWEYKAYDLLNRKQAFAIHPYEGSADFHHVWHLEGRT